MEAMMSQLVPIPERMEAGKLHYLHEEGVWYVHCKHCEVDKRLNARNEEEAYTGLHEWRLSMPNRKYQHRNWSCPRCAEYWQDTTPTATDTAEAASQLAPTTATTTDTAESASQEVQQLKAEVVELKAAIERLTAEVVEPKDEDTKQTKKARPGHTIAVAFTEDEATEMRDNAERTRELAESLLNLSSDMCGPCAPWSVEQIADQMQHDGNQIVTLSSRLLELFGRKGLLEHLSSLGV